jgi:hypothetical protein
LPNNLGDGGEGIFCVGEDLRGYIGCGNPDSNNQRGAEDGGGEATEMALLPEIGLKAPFEFVRHTSAAQRSIARSDVGHAIEDDLEG